MSCSSAIRLFETPASGVASSSISSSGGATNNRRRNLRFLPVILTCETGITLVESVFDTV
jgi:hypothetical protein